MSEQLKPCRECQGSRGKWTPDPPGMIWEKCINCSAATPSEDGGEVGQLLVTALRQYQHNDCSGLLAGYDCAEAERIVSDLIAQHSRIVAAKDAELRELRDSMTFRTSLIGRLEAELEQLRAQPARQVGGGELRIVFDGPPGPECGRFVEVENDRGASINAGEWRQRSDGLWELVITSAALAPAAVVMPERLAPRDEDDHEYIDYNRALDDVIRLNRRAIPEGLLERICARPVGGGVYDAIDELRALLGKGVE